MSENKINIEKIVQAGKAIKAIFTTVLLLIFCFVIGILVATNSTDSDTIKNTYILIGIMSLILNIVVLYNLYEAGDNLVNVKSLEEEEHDNYSVITELEIKKSRTGNFADGGIIVYTDNNEEHDLICSKVDLGKATWDDAKNLCKSYDSDGISDWRLPNINELILIQTFLYSNNLLGNSNQYYWSSTESSSDGVWLLQHGQNKKVYGNSSCKEWYENGKSKSVAIYEDGYILPDMYLEYDRNGSIK